MKFLVPTKRLSLLGIAAAAGLALASCGNTSYATQLWYDGFSLTSAGGDYVVNTPLAAPANPGDPLATPPVPATPAIAQSGGAGSFFANPWKVQGGSSHIVQGTSLTRPGQINPSIGGSVGDTDCCGRSSLTFATPWEGFDDPDGTFYMGFLVNFGTGPTEHHRVFEMHTGASLEDSNRILEFGYSTFTGIGTTMSLKVNNGTPVKLSENVNFHSDKGTTHFAVLKFEMSTTGNDVISAYLDPVGLIEPATPSAQVSVAAFTADSMGPVNFVFGNGGLPAFDELRVSDNTGGLGFSQVANNTWGYTAVPEPTTSLLFGFGTLGLLALARRKQK